MKLVRSVKLQNSFSSSGLEDGDVGAASLSKT